MRGLHVPPMPAAAALPDSPRHRTNPADRDPGCETAAGSIGVITLGGPHQLAHILPVAVELESYQPGAVTIYAPAGKEADAVRAFLQTSEGPSPRTVEMHLPAVLERLIPGSLKKLVRLGAWARRLSGYRVLLCAERTSTALRRLRADCPPILHIPHGAGDRAVGFEDRFTLFEHVFVAGQKDRDRLVAADCVAEERCTVTGPIKIAAMLANGSARPRLFDNDRPTILYNPHFSRKYRSIDAFGARLVEAVLKDGRYNLVVAPHVRLGRGWSARRRRDWEALSVPGRVLVDLGSPRCSDMTYTLAADLYLGDVSSQVYEFLVRPRPCLFVDAHGADWQDSQDYAMWHFGEVIAPASDPIAALDRAFSGHAAYRQRQEDRMRYAIHGIAWATDGTPYLSGKDPAAVTATIVARYAGIAIDEVLSPVV